MPRTSLLFVFAPALMSGATLLLFMTFSLSAHSIDDCELNGKPINTDNGAMTAGKSGLIRCKDRDTEQLRSEYELRNGVGEGFVRYYRKGKLELEFFRNGKGNRHGIAKKFNLAGQIIQQENYDNGSIVGLSQFWSSSGKLNRASYYEKGKSGPLASVSWTKDGLLHVLQCAPKPVLDPVFNDTKYCGHKGKPEKVSLYHHNGVLASQSVYLSGKKNSYTTFWRDGKTVASELLIRSEIKIKREFASDGTTLFESKSLLYQGSYYPQRERIYHETGPLVSEKKWAIIDGYEVLSLESTFYLNGQPKTREQYLKRDTDFVIESKNFHDNGQLSFNGRYIREDRYNQRPEGIHRFFNDNGLVIQALHYDVNGRVTREQSFSPEGKLTRDDEVFADGSRRAFAQ